MVEKFIRVRAHPPFRSQYYLVVKFLWLRRRKMDRFGERFGSAGGGEERHKENRGTKEGGRSLFHHFSSYIQSTEGSAEKLNHGEIVGWEGFCSRFLCS